MQYALIAAVMGYVMRVEPGWLCLSFALINMPMYSMEMNFIFTGSLSITAGDDGLGPVEMEVVMTIVYLLAAIFGIEGLNSTIAATLGDWVPKFLLWKHALASLFIFLLSLFTLENLARCAKHDLKRTIYYLLNPLLCLAFTILAGFMES